MIWSRRRRCPFCGSSEVRRSRRHDSFEKLVLPLLLRRPFRCLKCQERHYDFVFSRRIGIETTNQEYSQSK